MNLMLFFWRIPEQVTVYMFIADELAYVHKSASASLSPHWGPRAGGVIATPGVNDALADVCTMRP